MKDSAVNSWQETMEQCKPKRGRTKPCPNKPWKKAAKVYWRWEVFSGGHYRDRMLRDSAMAQCRIANIDGQDRLDLLSGHGISTSFPYGKERLLLPMNIPDWWKPPDKWNWRWKMTYAVDEDETIYEQTYWLSRVGEPLDPGRLP